MADFIFSRSFFFFLVVLLNSFNWLIKYADESPAETLDATNPKSRRRRRRENLFISKVFLARSQANDSQRGLSRYIDIYTAHLYSIHMLAAAVAAQLFPSSKLKPYGLVLLFSHITHVPFLAI